MISHSKILNLIKRAVKSSGPHHAQWFITRKCNYRCRGCSVWMNQGFDELSTEEVKHGLDILRDIGVLEIVFSGGNPLLRDDIGEILNYASKHFITTVYDNGSAVISRLEAIRNVDFVAISLDTLDERKNDYLKGVDGAWRRAMEAINILKREGIPVGVSPTISQMNLYEIIDFTKYFVERGIPVWYCLYSYDYSPSQSIFSVGRRNDEYEIRDGEALANICSFLMEMRRRSGYIYMTEKTLMVLRHLALTGERLWKCRALDNFLVVDHLGRVSGCHCRKPVASIFDLPKIWGSQYIKDLRMKYRECVGCTYLCYIFYSVHTGFTGLLNIVFDRWKSIRAYLRDLGNNS